jgi:carboxylate-amine ligase
MASLKPLNFGIEEEYFLSDLGTRELVRRPPPRFLKACEEALPGVLAPEMFVSQVEVATLVMSSLNEARDFLAHARTTLSWLGEESGLGIVAAGTHPLAQWRVQQPSDLPHYTALFDDMQMVAQRSVLGGLHVHVGVPGDRIVIMNRLLQWLPLLLALSASSPFWDGRVSGLHSYRQAASDEWPRMGMPEHFDDQDGYERYLDALVATGSVRTRSDVWWNIRPSQRYPTVELRITDACPRLEDALCIAGLFRAMVTYAASQSTPGPGGDALHRQLFKENRWRAKRYGIYSDYIEPGTQHSISLASWLEKTWAVIGDSARVGGDESVYAHAQGILATGNSAAHQLNLYNAAISRGASLREALSGVVDQLRNQTLAV